jgi:AcrR family transcriptional regulator
MHERHSVSVPRQLPRGASSASREVVLMSQRARLLEAVVEAVADVGYTATTVQEITRRARVSRTTFYEQFANREDCFLVAYEAGARAHLEHMRAAVEHSDGWIEQLHTGTRAYVQLFAERPAYARAFLLEVHKAGERALERRREIHRQYADLLREWHARRPANAGGPVSDEFFAGAVGAINELVVEHLHEAGSASLAELAPTISQMLLALFGANQVQNARRAQAKARRLPPQRDDKQQSRAPSISQTDN